MLMDDPPAEQDGPHTTQALSAGKHVQTLQPNLSFECDNLAARQLASAVAGI